jgi:histidine phosphotransferase ChpT
MDQMPDLRPPANHSDDPLFVSRLLCTRLCHDLAGPIGAVAAGVELTSGDPTQIDAETLALIGSSSSAASRKLKFLRAALGVPAAMALGDLSPLVEGYLEASAAIGETPTLLWPSPDKLAVLANRLGNEAVSLLLNMCLLVAEALPLCRALTVRVVSEPSLGVIVEGESSRQREPSWRQEILDLATGAADVNPTAKTIQAYMTGRLVAHAGGRLELASAPPCLRATFVCP